MEKILFYTAILLVVIFLSIAGRGDYRDAVVENNFNCSMIQQGYWPKETGLCQNQKGLIH